jgi:hypothetical protein
MAPTLSASHGEIADAAALLDELGVEQQGDVLARRDGVAQRRDQGRALAVAGEELPPRAHASADLARALHEVDGDPHVGEGQRRPHPGDARPDDHRRPGRLDPQVGQGCAEARAGDPGAHEVRRLRRRRSGRVAVRPRALLPDVALRVHVRVEPGALRHRAEGRQVQLGGAGGDDDPVEALGLDGLLHLLLRRVGAGEQEGLGHRHPGLARRRGADLLHLHEVGDVAAAVADEGADLRRAHRAPPAAARRRRYEATWETAAPEWRIVSGMSLIAEAVPATNTPSRLVFPGSRSSSTSFT